MPNVLNIHYFDHGSEQENQPPVLLIHGAGGNHLSWPLQIRRLPGRRVFAMDLPGHGKSQGADRNSIDAYVEDVIGFMRSLAIDSAVFVGVSMGSAIALALALKYPEKVNGLALLGSGAKLRVAASILDAVGSADTFEDTVIEINKNCFSANAPHSLIHLSTRAMLQMSPSALHGDFLACNKFDVSEQLEKINIPVLVICGSEDKMTPLKYSESLNNKLANSRLQVVDGAGHMAMLEQPDLVAGMLAQFIETLPLHSGRST